MTMDWSQVLTIVISNMAMFMWATRQARTDFLCLMKVLDTLIWRIADLTIRVKALESKGTGVDGID